MCSVYLYETLPTCIITCIRHELALLVMAVGVLIVYVSTVVSSVVYIVVVDSSNGLVRPLTALHV